jgi:hypothetical protein
MIFKPAARTIIPILSLLFAFSILAFQHTENNQQSNEKQLEYGLTLIELFTSQGCSSCPPADELLASVKNNDNVIALSYHVDYWNKLGWKDPYSDASFSAYQRKYASQLKSGVYTPQMVINGSSEFVGSRKSSLQQSLSNKSSVTALNKLTVKRSGKVISFSYELDGLTSFDNGYALLVLDEHTTNVTRGENSKRKLKNSNVVLQRVAIDKKAKDRSGAFTIPESTDTDAKYRVAIILQNKDLKVVSAGLSNLG